MKKLGFKIAFANQKGGVGKTVAAYNVSSILASRGYKVLVVDNDSQGQSTMAYLGDDLPNEIVRLEGNREEYGSANTASLYDGSQVISPVAINENLDLLGASKHLVKVGSRDEVANFIEGVNSLAESYDFIIIDCPPSLGDLQEAALIAASHVLIPTLFEAFGESGVGEILKTINSVRRLMNRDLEVLGIVANRVSGKITTLESGFRDIYIENYGDLVFDKSIVQSITVCESIAFMKPIFDYKPESKSALSFVAVVDEMLQRLEVKGA